MRVAKNAIAGQGRSGSAPGALETAYQVHELFASIQGEGMHAGETSIFLRLQGCPVGCVWCDSKLTWYAGGERWTVRDLIARLAELPPARWCVITGGEPLIYNLDALLLSIHSTFPNTMTQIETSGAYPFKGQARPTHVTVSPKHAAHFNVAKNVLHAASELKYVVDEHFDEQVAIKHLNDAAVNHFNFPRVSLMPEGSPPRDAMIARTLAILREHHDWSFSPRLQYAYPQIGAMEGDANSIISKDEAKARSKEHARHRQRKSTVSPEDVRHT